MAIFSERQGVVKPEPINPAEMTLGLKNRLWNTAKDYIEEFRYNPDRNDVIKYVWDRFFKENIDELNGHETFDGRGVYYFIDQIREKFYQLEWYKVYDFIEFILGLADHGKKDFIISLNIIFIDERAPYKIIDGLITPLISEEESADIERAIEGKYEGASNHIKKALELYRKRPVADYKNSIKESISAIEAIARIVLTKPSATLGELADKLNIHPAFQDGIKKFYGWTSDEGGIRHAEKNTPIKIDEAEARFMLVMCSALVNYITSKYE